MHAARRPGMLATRTASARARTPIRATVPPGTVGAGTALISPAKRSQSARPSAMPTGIPTAHPDHGGHARLHGHHEGELASGEAQCLEDGQVVPPAPDQRHEREAERGRRADRQGGTQQKRRRAERPVVDEIGAGRSTPNTEPPLMAMSTRRPMDCSDASAARLGPPLVRTRMAFGPGVTSKRFRAAGGMIR